MNFISFPKKKEKKKKQIEQGNSRIIEKKGKNVPQVKNLNEPNEMWKNLVRKFVQRSPFFIAFRPFTVSLQTNMRSC